MGKKSAAQEEKKADSAENIRVLVRCRPLNSKELEAGYKSCVDLDLSEATVTVNHVCGNPDRWTFDAVINNTYTQRDVFTQYIMPMVDSVLDGFNATVFAYGQSGSGKTHTMTGKIDDAELKGLIPRSFEHVFNTIRQVQSTNPNKRFTLYCSFIELYNNKIRDLLAKQQVTLPVKENKDKTFFVQGAHVPQVKFPEDLYRHMEEGTERRQVASTELNADSSRSHSIFTLIVECTETTEDGDTRSVTSKLNLVDLAGSERQSKTGASGDTLKEGCNINLSLSALGTVIDTLVKGKGHVPFRSSPLTMLLKDSLGGSSKTVMFANIGPSEHNLSETVSTLRFADRAKQIKNKPVVNMDTKDQKIAELTEMVHELKEKLKQYETGGFQDMEKELEELREKVGEIEIERDNAVKGRESDALDFESARQQLQADVDATRLRADELEERLQRVEQDLLIAEQCVKDERAQRAEIWHVCSDFFECEIASVDALLAKVKDNKHGANSAAFLELQSQNHVLEQDLRAARDQHQAEVAELKTQVDQANERHKAAVKKFEKAKEMLEQERSARKQLVETHHQQQQQAGGGGAGGTFSTSPTRNSMRQSHEGSIGAIAALALSSGGGGGGATGSNAGGDESWLVQKHDLEARHAEEIAVLRDELARAEAAIAENTRAKELEAELQRVTAVKNEKISALLNELQQTTEMVSAGTEDDSVAVSNMRKLVAAKDEALGKARAEAEGFEAVVEQLKAQLAAEKKRKRHGKAASAAAAAPPSSSAAAASPGTDAPSSVDAQLATLHQTERLALRRELQQTADHRNAILRHLIDGGANDADVAELKTMVDAIVAENERLRELRHAAEAARDAAKTDELAAARLRERVAELEAGAVGDAARADQAEVLGREVTRLQAQIETMRTDFDAQQATLTAALTEAAAAAAAAAGGPTMSPTSPSLAGGAGAGAGGGAAPLQAVIDVLQADKKSLLEQLRRVERENHAMALELAAAARAHTEDEAALAEVARLRGVLTTPSAGDSDEVVALKTELAKRDEQLAAAKAASLAAPNGGSAGVVVVTGLGDLTSSPTSTTTAGAAGAVGASIVVSADAVAEMEDAVRRAEAALQQRTSMLEIERQELTQEATQLRGEAEAEREARERAEAELKQAQHDAKQAHADLTNAQRTIVALENKLNEQRAEFARLQQSSEGFTSQIAQFEARLKERTDQLADVRKILDKQKELTQATQQKNESLKEQVAALRADAKAKAAEFAQALVDKEEAIHKAMNKKIEAIAAEHQKDLARKDEDIQKVKKKLKKMEAQVQKAKEKYDEKVLEYEELANAMEEQKVEAMKLMKETHVVEIEEQKGQIGDALKRAKEERQRQKDMFAMGETQSALSKMRAAGSAAATVKQLKGSGSSGGGGGGRNGSGSGPGANGRPPRSPATQTPTDDGLDEDYDF